MALVLNDRVKETSTTTGTGTLNLSGAVSGFQTFVAGVGNGNTTYYAIVNRDADEWETGLGTVTDASTDTLARTTVIASSNSDSAVDFSAGTKDVFVTLPASKVANLDTNNNLTIGAGSAGVDYTLTFDGADSDGVLTWMEDEDYFKFSDDILINSTEKLQFQDTGTYIYSNADGDLDVVSDGTAIDSINIESAGGITLDAGSTTHGITYEDDGTAMLQITNSSSDVIIKPLVDAKDIIFQQYDGTEVARIEDNATFNVSSAGKFAYAGTAVTTTAAELNLIDGGTARGTTSVASGDGILINDGGTMRMTNVDTVSTYFASHSVGGSNIVTTGALNSGSITSGFGTIDTGSSTITTTGLITGGSLDIDDVLINGTTIGHTDDTDLITVADGLVTVAGEISVTTLDIGGTNVASTAAELNIMDGGTSATSTTLVNADRFVANDNGTMVQVALSDLKTYLTSAGFSSEDPTALAIALG